MERRDKRVSSTKKKNREKVENGLSPAFPKTSSTMPANTVSIP